MTEPNESTFEIIGRGPSEYVAPDGTTHTEKWWDDLQENPERPSKEKIPELIEQIAEDFPGGRQSCFLTSQLNAYILRGLITPEEAREVQDRVATDEEYKDYWHDQSQFGNDFVAWSGDPKAAAYAITKITGKRMGYIVGGEGTAFEDSDIAPLLEKGYVLVVNGERHSQVVFSPAPNIAYTFDSKYPEATGQSFVSTVQDSQESFYFVII